MIETVEEMQAALQGTPLEGRRVQVFQLFSRPALVFGIELDAQRHEEEFEALVGLMPRTGRRPVLTNPDNTELQFNDEPMAASSFSEDQLAGHELRESLAIDGLAFISTGGDMRQFSPTCTTDSLDHVDVEGDPRGHVLGATQRRFGAAPTVDEIRSLRRAGLLRTDADLERWLFEWEIARFGDAALAPPDLGHLGGSEFDRGEPRVAVLMPTLSSWAAFFDLGWYGGVDGGPGWLAGLTAAMRHWGERYGAELVASFVTTMYIKVARRPETPAEAFDLAVQHYHFAPCTLILPSVSLRDHARALMAVDRWFFHERP